MKASMLNPHKYAVTVLGPGRSVLHLSGKIIYPSQNQLSNGILRIKNCRLWIISPLIDILSKILAKLIPHTKEK